MNPEQPYEPLPRDLAPVRRRDRHQVTAVALTGLATAGSLAATGWLAGQAVHGFAGAHAPASSPASDPAATAPADPGTRTARPAATRAHRARPRPRVQVEERERPTRTRVSTRYVTAPAPVGGGGTVSAAPTHQVHSSPPAPSSGS